MLQAMRAEDEVQGSIGKGVERKGVLMFLFPDWNRPRKWPLVGTDIDPRAGAVEEGFLADEGTGITVVQVIGIELPSISVVDAIRKPDLADESPVELPPQVAAQSPRIRERQGDLAGNVRALHARSLFPSLDHS